MPHSGRVDRGIGGILLTGGGSSRMGFDKASMAIGGVPCARRVAAVLQEVVSVTVEVGPGASGLCAVREDRPGSGPLAAVASGARALAAGGRAFPALVVACDLPLLTREVLSTLAAWPGHHSVVPVIEGRPQPLCARWSAADLSAATELVDRGRRSMHALLDRPGVELVDEAKWPGRVDRRAFADVDSPADLDRLGLVWRAPRIET